MVSVVEKEELLDSMSMARCVYFCDDKYRRVDLQGRRRSLFSFCWLGF